MGLQCLNAHFNSFDLSELSSEMMQVASKGTQSAKQKGDTLLNSLLAVLSSLVVHPLATKQGYGGHLKPMWDTAVEVAKYINHSLDEWMQWYVRLIVILYVCAHHDLFTSCHNVA